MTIKWVHTDPLVMNGEPFLYGTRDSQRFLSFGLQNRPECVS